MIKRSATEGDLHCSVKAKAMRMLAAKEQFITLETEYRVNSKECKCFSKVDIYIKYVNEQELYGEVKSNADILSAMTQLYRATRLAGDDNIKKVAIVKPFSSIIFRKALRKNWNGERIKKMLNETDIYVYDDKLNIARLDFELLPDGYILNGVRHCQRETPARIDVLINIAEIAEK